MKVIINKMEGLEVNTQITVLDKAGEGGASHHYYVTAPQSAYTPAIPEGYQRKDDFALIHFQEGPVQANGINGCQVEDLLLICIDRLTSFQAGPYPCDENSKALALCQAALSALNRRTADRAARGVEGRDKA